MHGEVRVVKKRQHDTPVVDDAQEPTERGVMLDERTQRDLVRVFAIGAMKCGYLFLQDRLQQQTTAASVRRGGDDGVGEDRREAAHAHRRDPQPPPPPPINDERTLVPVPPERSLADAPPLAATRFLDEKQLCAELGISPVTSTKWRRHAEGPPFIRVGRLIRYPREALDAWLASRTVGRRSKTGEAG